MKKMTRFFSLLLTLCIIIGSLAACQFEPYDPSDTSKSTGTDAVTNQPESTGTETDSNQPGQETPDESDPLAYTLTQADLDGFRKILTRCREIFLNGSAASEEEMQQVLDSLDKTYYHIATQSSLAYIYYCMDQESENASDAYLFASSAESDLYAEYMELCREIDKTNSAEKEFFFREWTDEDLAAMRNYSAEINTLSKANDELLVQYRALSEDDFYDGSLELYAKMIKNNNRIAVLNGYENYWQYAYSEVYYRDYDAKAVQELRRQIKEIYIPLCEQATEAFVNSYWSLNNSQKVLLDELWDSDCTRSNPGRVSGYFGTFDQDISEVFSSVFQTENSFFATSESAYEGAFTGYLYDYERPICYFGPGYQNMYTIVHEAGHYFAEGVNDSYYIGMDLAETQSQGNEWLFTAYLDGVLNAQVAKVNRLYQLCMALNTVILGVIVDDFEQRCYEAENADVTFIQNTIAAVLKEYNGEEWLSEYIADVDMYLRYVVLESPVYYISYSASMLAAMQIYCISKNESYQDAQDVYLYIAILEDPEIDFLSALQDAGLYAPSDKRTAQMIQTMLN